MRGFRPARHRAFGRGARARRPAVILHCMRDEHRPKQDLINEVTACGSRWPTCGGDDRAPAASRTRSATERQSAPWRTAPVGLCLLRRDGSPIAANRPFARQLGYETTAELLRVGDTLGIFGSREELGRVLALVERGLERTAGVVFRRKDGGRRSFGVIGAASLDTPGAGRGKRALNRRSAQRTICASRSADDLGRRQPPSPPPSIGRISPVM